MARLTTRRNRILLGCDPIDMWGIRTASGTMDQAQTDHLIDQLDAYPSHGVNALAVYYAGCSGGYYDPFSPDGETIDEGHADRMRQIASACEERDMVLVAGIFYQRAPLGLQDRGAMEAAVRSVTDSLRGCPNVIINIANEQNSKNWQRHAHIIDMREPEAITALCGIVRETDPDRIVGCGGYDHEKNIQIGLSDTVDMLLFDTCNDERSAKLHDRFVATGIEKPLVNVELFDAWTKTETAGVYPEKMKASFRREVEAAVALTGLSVFFHSNSWCQDDGNRYDLAGQGAASDPGIRWYFEHVAKAKGI